MNPYAFALVTMLGWKRTFQSIQKYGSRLEARGRSKDIEQIIYDFSLFRDFDHFLITFDQVWGQFRIQHGRFTLTREHRPYQKWDGAVFCVSILTSFFREKIALVDCFSALRPINETICAHETNFSLCLIVFLPFFDRFRPYLTTFNHRRDQIRPLFFADCNRQPKSFILTYQTLMCLNGQKSYDFSRF